jgi:putative flippase GtrA
MNQRSCPPEGPAAVGSRTLIRYVLTGFVGFLVDAGALHAIIALWRTDLYLARAFSFTCAATTTWVLNRHVTFSARGKSKRGIVAEWAAYMAASMGGGFVNYATFAIAVGSSPFLHRIPSIAVGIGTLAGTTFNFVMYSRYVFVPRRK